MSQFIFTITILAMVLSSSPSLAQDNSAALVSYFSGKQVLVKIDMPGTQKGIDLRFNKPSAMDWKEYQGRLKQFGVAIRQGDVARVTSVVVKKDLIEFQLDGGGFGTFGDDSNTTVAPKVLDKTDYQKDLEKQIKETDDPDRRLYLQRELDRARARREQQNSMNASDAQVASQMKSQEVAGKRMQGGSRFNLRWSGSIPPDQLTPEAVMQNLSEYINFNASPSADNGSSAANNAPPQAAPADDPNASTPATAKLQRGMKMDDVTALFGPGKQISESVGDAGLKTQIFEYSTSDRHVQVTYVDGIVVRYTISSN
jgi:hypothetical protein